MKTKLKRRIPTFKTLEEEANFWDTHSFVDFEDELKDVEIIVDLHKKTDDTLVLRIQKSLKKKLATAAKKRGISISSLSRILLTEQIQSLRT